MVQCLGKCCVTKIQDDLFMPLTSLFLSPPLCCVQTQSLSSDTAAITHLPLQFFSGLAKDVCSACTSSGSSSHGAATGAAFLSEVLLSAAHIEGTQGLRLILALTEVREIGGE